MPIKSDSALRRLASLVLVVSLPLIGPTLPARADQDGAGSPLDGQSFKVVATIRDFQTGTRIVTEERYSHEQARGIVQQRFRYDGPAESAEQLRQASRAVTTQTYLVDSGEAVALVHSDLTNSCESFQRDAVMRALRIDFIDFDMHGRDYIFGAARLLHYFTRIRSQLRADVSGEKFAATRGPSIKYSKQFVSPAGGRVEVGVFYSEISLEPSRRDRALPVMIRVEWPDLAAVKGLLVEFSPVTFVEGDSLAERPQLGLELDALLVWPVFGCSQRLTKRYRFPWSSSEAARQPYRFSFRASVRTLQMRPAVASLNEAVFELQVAYDVWINKMRVDTKAPDKMPVARSTQIFDFSLDKMTHVLPRPARDKYDFVSELIGGNILRASDGDAQNAPPDRTSYRCANAEINSSTTRALTLTLDNLLLGTAGDFAYLGLARVRGIRARLFEATATRQPFWMDPQMYLRDSENVAENRSGSPLFVTLVYFSEPPSATEPARLLLVEIYELDRHSNSVLSKRDVSVHDFAWNLQAIRARADLGSGPASGGDAALGLFSLIDLCSEWTASRDDQADAESHADFKMLLESVDPLSGSTHLWLADSLPEVRSALVSALQLEMHLISGLVYDLETRFVDLSSKQQATGKTPAGIVLSFKVGRLPSALTKMMYLGQGRRRPGQSWFLRVFSRQECFMIAAHLKAEMEFAHDPKTSSCFIALEPRDKRRPEGAFAMDMAAEMSIFKTLKVRDYHKISREWWLNEPLREDYRKRGLRLDLSLQERPVKFSITSLKVSEHNPTLAGGDAKVLSAPNVILGFALLERESSNRAAVLSGGADEQFVEGLEVSEERMTFGQCQALCLADFDCRAYSFCVRGAIVSCVLSRADLGKPEVFSKISSHVRGKSTSTQSIQIALGEGQSLTLQKSKHCAIYAKQYLEYYSRSNKDLVTSAKFESIKAADSAEECAGFCFAAMLNSSADYYEHVQDSLAKFESGASGGGDLANLAEKVEHLKRAVKATGCNKFYYFSAGSLGREAREALAKMARKEDVEEVSEPAAEVETRSAYCAMSGGGQAQMSAADFKQHQVLVVDTFALRTERLYEAEHGVKLRPASLTSDEELALNRVRQQTADAASIGTVRRSLARGDNFQLMTIVDKELCATYCFTQATGLWPLCRSFDMIHYKRNNQSHVRCLLNSLSKTGALEMGRSDLIDSSHAFDLQEERWHYEPKRGFLFRRQIDWEEEALSLLAHDNGDHLFGCISPLVVKMIVCVILGCAIGICSHFVTRERERRGSSSSALEIASNAL